MISVAVLLSAGIVLAAVAAMSGGAAEETRLAGGEASEGSGAETEEINVLLMGLDGQSPGAGEGPPRTDALMLAQVDPESGDTALISIPRDLYVEGVAPDGGSQRINSAYAHGGPERAVEAVEELTGVPVDHYVAADFEGFEEVVDSLGGVEVDVEGDYLAKRGIPQGEQILNGKEALLYARYRGTPEGDLGRIERQQQLLAALRSQAVSWESIASIPGIVRSLNEHVQTDMSTAEMISLGRALARADGGELQTASLKGEPVTLSDGRQVLMPEEAVNEEIVWGSFG